MSQKIELNIYRIMFIKVNTSNCKIDKPLKFQRTIYVQK